MYSYYGQRIALISYQSTDQFHDDSYGVFQKQSDSISFDGQGCLEQKLFWRVLLEMTYLYSYVLLDFTTFSLNHSLILLLIFPSTISHNIKIALSISFDVSFSLNSFISLLLLQPLPLPLQLPPLLNLLTLLLLHLSINIKIISSPLTLPWSHLP